MIKQNRLIMAFAFFGLLLPQASYSSEIDDNKTTFAQLVIAQALLITLQKGLEWYTKEEPSHPVCPLTQQQPCPLLFFKTLANTSETYIKNLATLRNMHPDHPDIKLLLHNGVTIHQKIQQALKQVESMTAKQREQLRLVQEQAFSERDLKILALLKEREYKNIPQNLLWQAKRDEYVRVSGNPDIWISKELLKEYHNSLYQKENV